MKLGNDERLFEKIRKKIKSKKENKFYNIHGGDYKLEIEYDSSYKPCFICQS